MSLKNRARDANHDFLDEPIASDPLLRSSGVQAKAQRHVSSRPAASSAEALPLISIGAPADASLLDPAYAYLSSYCFALFPPRVAERLNVAIYELYSNALRHGAKEGEVRLELRRDGDSASLRVTNFAQPSNVSRLARQVALVRENAEAAFNGEMERFGGESQPPPMLGIVRVAHESGLTIELTVDGARVDVSTRCDG